MFAPTEAEVFAAATPRDGHFPVAQVQARVACPDTGGIKRVRLAVDRRTGTIDVVKCGRFGRDPVTCRQHCLMPALPW